MTKRTPNLRRRGGRFYYRQRVPLMTFAAFKQDPTAQQQAEARLKAPDDIPTTPETKNTPPEAS